MAFYKRKGTILVGSHNASFLETDKSHSEQNWRYSTKTMILYIGNWRQLSKMTGEDLL